MDNEKQTTHPIPPLSGIFVRGVVVSSTARAFKRKDGSGTVARIRHELALQPGLAIYEQYLEPNDPGIRIEGEIVVQFPKLREFAEVTLRVLRWHAVDGRLLIKEAELITGEWDPASPAR